MNVGSSPLLISDEAGAVIDIRLDVSALTSAAQAAWRDFLIYACDSVGRVARIETFFGLPPVSSLPFVYLTASAALTRKLLLYGAPIYIQPETAPECVDSHVYWHWLAQRRDVPLVACLKPVQRSVTLISSVFRGDDFLVGFLRNSARLQGYADCEHLLIRAASPGNEHEHLVKHVRAHPGAVYLNLAQDPGLYAVWNLGVQLATGRFLSNANIDDRRAPEQLLFLQAELTRKPEVDVASTALRVSTQKNLDWEASSDCPLLFGNVPDRVYHANALFSDAPKGLSARNLPHCMPLWRRSLHACVGLFDEKRFGPSADWAFWLQAGRHGTAFTFSARPLGLYLRDENSYWRKDPANRRFDAHIVLTFSDLAHVAGSMPVHGSHRPAAVEKWADSAALQPKIPDPERLSVQPVACLVAQAISALRAGACYEGIGWLLRAAVSEMYQHESTRMLVDKAASRFLGCADFGGVAMRFAGLTNAGGSFQLALFNALVDLAHGFEPLRLGEEEPAIARILAFGCHDLHACSGDIRGLLLLALLARKRMDLAAEQVLLQHLHVADAAAFWSHFQSVYRFVRPLADVCGAVTTIPPKLVFSQPASDQNVTFFPDYSDNTYLSLLYASLRKAGASVRGTSDMETFLSVEPVPGQANLLHVHWVNPLFGSDVQQGKAQIEARAATFLAKLARQKRRGFSLYWTIHNRLSHETSDPAAEIAFRQALYRLADRVFIHHPLAVSVLDWLPDTNKLCLGEHGDFGVAAAENISRTEARQSLGLAETDFVVTHVGHVRDYKGLTDYLPVLFEQLVSMPRMQLVIAGQIRSRSVRRWLDEHRHPRLMVRNAFLSEADLVAQMRAADIGFLSYDSVLTSGSLFHWLTCGRAVLAPASGTIPAYLVDGWNGFVYKDADSLKRVLALCARLSDAELAQLGFNAGSVAKQLAWGMCP